MVDPGIGSKFLAGLGKTALAAVGPRIRRLFKERKASREPADVNPDKSPSRLPAPEAGEIAKQAIATLAPKAVRQKEDANEEPIRRKLTTI